MNCLMIVGGINAELPYVVKFLQVIPLPGLRKYVKYREVLDKYNCAAVNNAHKHKGEQIIFSPLVGESETLTDEEIMVEATDLAIAGTDTTSIPLTFMLPGVVALEGPDMVWVILSRPELQHQLKEEVATLPDDFTDTQVEELRLLNAVINESMRLWGPSQGTFPRCSPRDGMDLGGYYIPAGVTVGSQSYTVHRLESLFKNANE
ncbi:hypothetical protein GTA08_BOTSDO00007 [Botryosphaeria dothidea]|uniref:Cytochrome p450 protein n=1 Tax=Botryosphaeria dothidea TaxID=55169 RepID=A0A8H4J988_9PEZI|nr:hypothetical protein GTA08_BOTSDO00007 [Botryosphaeria dothidea]